MADAVLEEEAQLVQRIRAGDEVAFASLVEAHGPAMLRFACLYTQDSALAEDAVQDAWLGALHGLGAFEARASLRTWLFRILLNRLRSRLRDDAHLVPFSAGFDATTSPSETALPADRFLAADHPRWPRHWRQPPVDWGLSPEERVLANETRAVIARAVAALPAAQREVITLRDMDGWSAKEVCELLSITPSNQRVLLHRARSKVRRSLEEYLTKD